MTNTEDLIDQLAAESALAPAPYALSFALPILAAMLACAAGVLLVLEGPFASVEAHGIGPLMVKWGFSLALLALCAPALWVLGKPGRTTRWVLAAITLPFIPIAALLVYELALAGPMLGAETWWRCLLAMAIMSPLAFAGAIYALRALAPTNPQSAGLVAGLFGGAVAMTAYAPFCPERGMMFMTIFYCLPMLAMGGIGWLAGARLLRW